MAARSTRPSGHDLLDPSTHARPDLVRKLADESGPVYWSEKWRAWFVTGYQECFNVLRDQRFSVEYNARKPIQTQDLSAEALGLLREIYCGGLTQFTFAGGRSLLVMDAPEHTQYRRLLMRHFSEREAINLISRIEEIVNGLLDGWATEDEVELMSGFAYKLPILLFGDILGIPQELRSSFIDYRAFTESRAAKSQFATTEDYRRVASEGPVFREKIDTIIAAKRKCPADDIFSTLLTGKVNGEAMSETQLRSMIYMLNTASQTTTTSLIGNSVYQFQRFGLWQHLALHPELLPEAIEEVVRFDPPSSPYFGRQVTADLEFAGQQMEKGETALVFVGAANRDPKVFESPDDFVPNRNPNKHLGFGLGSAHFCLGASFARKEALVSLKELLKRYPNLTLSGEPERAKAFGFAQLPVKLH
jgi:cytochrome P450 family 109